MKGGPAGLGTAPRKAPRVGTARSRISEGPARLPGGWREGTWSSSGCHEAGDRGARLYDTGAQGCFFIVYLRHKTKPCELSRENHTLMVTGIHPFCPLSKRHRAQSELLPSFLASFLSHLVWLQSCLAL